MFTGYAIKSGHMPPSKKVASCCLITQKTGSAPSTRKLDDQELRAKAVNPPSCKFAKSRDPWARNITPWFENEVKPARVIARSVNTMLRIMVWFGVTNKTWTILLWRTKIGMDSRLISTWTHLHFHMGRRIGHITSIGARFHQFPVLQISFASLKILPGSNCSTTQLYPGVILLRVLSGYSELEINPLLEPFWESWEPSCSGFWQRVHGWRAARKFRGGALAESWKGQNFQEVWFNVRKGRKLSERSTSGHLSYVGGVKKCV